jgi:hypothetical protein
MAKQPSEEQDAGRSTSPTTFNDLKKEIAARNEQAHKEARELRAAREQKELGISSRHQLDLDR